MGELVLLVAGCAMVLGALGLVVGRWLRRADRIQEDSRSARATQGEWVSR